MSDTPAADSEGTSERTREEGQKLCLACGMCCNGDLFANTWLYAEEVSGARGSGLPIVRNARGNPAFAQPCPKHEADGRCAIYADSRKPRACDSFQCKLLRRYLRGEVSTEESFGYVDQARARIAALRRKIGRERDGAIWTQLIEWSASLRSREAETRMEIGVLIHLLDKVFLPPDAEADVAPWPAERAVPE